MLDIITSKMFVYFAVFLQNPDALNYLDWCIDAWTVFPNVTSEGKPRLHLFLFVFIFAVMAREVGDLMRHIISYLLINLSTIEQEEAYRVSIYNQIFSRNYEFQYYIFIHIYYLQHTCMFLVGPYIHTCFIHSC